MESAHREGHPCHLAPGRRCHARRRPVLREADKFFTEVESACEDLRRQKSSDGTRSRRTRNPRPSVRGRNCASASRTSSKTMSLCPSNACVRPSANSSSSPTTRTPARRPRRMQPPARGIARGNRPCSSARAPTTMSIGWNAPAGRKNLALNAAPIDVADFLRLPALWHRHLHHHDQHHSGHGANPSSDHLQGQSSAPHSALRTPNSALSYFVHRVGAEDATVLQTGTPFDCERQMKLFITSTRSPDPRDSEYRDSLIHWIKHFRRPDPRQGLRPLHQLQVDARSPAN